MTSQQIRQSFLDFFRARDHRIVPSAPVIPHGDATLLFTNAGMNQFKDVFLGTGTREYRRAADTQKCIRVSGKHNDLEEVGHDTYHHTFFEMLGNWSFGDYHKREAIAWAWELLTGIWGLEKRRLHATVYRSDDEAYRLWREVTDIDPDRIHRFDEKDNFWMMGETGPCGPCSEIHFDRTPDCSGGALVNAGTPEVIEIWNLVFIQYNRAADGTLAELPAMHVDTGMGFERICAVLQGKNSNYDTDVFAPLIEAIARISGFPYTEDRAEPASVAMRVIADHVRMLTFSIADGAMPGNEGRGYVLRRILRRAARYARNLNLHDPVLYRLVPALVDTMGEVFPEIRERRALVERVIRAEEEAFGATLDNGIGIFTAMAERARRENDGLLRGEEVFKLYDTYGFPVDLTELMARDAGMTLDRAGFDRLLEEQKQRSRDARKAHRQEVALPPVESATAFEGYETTTAEGTVLYAAENQVVLDRTPFYVEAGGQVSDTGAIILAGTSYPVVDVRKHGNAYIHILDGEVEPLVGDRAMAVVDAERRNAIRRNHSATHLVHEALRRVLGTHVKQAGSLVAPDHLRFDFPHFHRIGEEELRDIEQMVNGKILENIEVGTEEMSIASAQKIPGIKMFFGDKYGERVRVVTIDEGFSREFCGGTHVGRTAEIGLFKIVSEGSIAAGTRRIEAVTGGGVERYIRQLHERLDERRAQEEALLEKIRTLEKELNRHKLEQAQQGIDALIGGAAVWEEAKIVAARVEAADLDQLKALGDRLREKLRSGAGLLAAVIEEKVQIVCVVTDDLIASRGWKAGTIVGRAARLVGGGGGGKPHLATAGGREVAKLEEMLQQAVAIITGS